MTKSSFLALVLSSLPAPASIQLRPGQTEEEAVQARRDATSETLRLTYPDEVLPPVLCRAYRIAGDGGALFGNSLPADDKTRGGILGRAETAGQIADLLVQTEAREEIGSLSEIARFWAKRADEIEAQTADLIAAGKHPNAVAAIVATLRREAKFLDEFLASLAASA